MFQQKLFSPYTGVHRCSGCACRHHSRHRRKHPPVLRRSHDSSPHQPARCRCASKRETAHFVGFWRYSVGGGQEFRQVHRHRHADTPAGRPDQSRHGMKKKYLINNTNSKLFRAGRKKNQLKIK